MDAPTYTYQESKVLAHCIKLVEKSLKVLKRKIIQCDPPPTHTQDNKRQRTKEAPDADIRLAIV